MQDNFTEKETLTGEIYYNQGFCDAIKLMMQSIAWEPVRRQMQKKQGMIPLLLLLFNRFIAPHPNAISRQKAALAALLRHLFRIWLLNCKPADRIPDIFVRFPHRYSVLYAIFNDFHSFLIVGFTTFGHDRYSSRSRRF